MLDLSKVQIETKEQTSDYGRFVIEPLEQGYGYTVGNSLRRVLLTSLPGAAITSIKINGVTHQYTTTKGMSEDIIEFVLKVKQVRLRMGKKEAATLTLSAKGPAEVTAGSIKVSGDVEVINKDLVLATLAKGASLEAEMVAEVGAGYSTAEERPSNEVGTIPVDALYNPVVRVNYTVDATRVGRITNFDKLTMEVFTDGTLEPLAAIRQSAQILTNVFGLFLNETSQGKAPSQENNQVPETISLRPIDELDLPVRVVNSLKSHGIETIGALTNLKRKDLNRVRNLGAKSIEMIEKELALKSLSLS